MQDIILNLTKNITKTNTFNARRFILQDIQNRYLNHYSDFIF